MIASRRTRGALWLGAVCVAAVPGQAGGEPKPLAELRGHRDPIWSIDFCSDGKTLVGLEGTDPSAKLLVWDVATGKVAVTIPVASSAIIGSLAVSRDGRVIAVASGKDVTICPLASPERSIKVEGVEYPVLSLDFSPDGRQLTVGGGDRKNGVLQIHDAVSGKRLRSLTGHTKEVGGVKFMPDGKHLISAGYDKTVRVWDVASATTVATREAHERSVECLLVRPDGKLAASADMGGTVRLWDLPSGKAAGVLNGHPGAVLSAAFSPDGRLLAVATGAFASDGEVWLWDVATSKRVGRFQGEPLPVRSVAFSPDGKKLASVCGYEPVRLWDVAGLLADYKD